VQIGEFLHGEHPTRQAEQTEKGGSVHGANLGRIFGWMVYGGVNERIVVWGEGELVNEIGVGVRY
jgi:hypothetical protein